MKKQTPQQSSAREQPDSLAKRKEPQAGLGTHRALSFLLYEVGLWAAAPSSSSYIRDAKGKRVSIVLECLGAGILWPNCPALQLASCVTLD